MWCIDKVVARDEPTTFSAVRLIGEDIDVGLLGWG